MVDLAAMGFGVLLIANAIIHFYVEYRTYDARQLLKDRRSIDRLIERFKK